MSETAKLQISCPYCRTVYQTASEQTIGLVIACPCGGRYERQWWCKPGAVKKLGIWSRVGVQ